MRATSQQVTVAPVQPASHHRPSFGGSPPMKPTGVDAAHHLSHSGGRQPASPKPPLLPTAGPLASEAAGCMIGSQSNPLVGSTRQTGATVISARNTVTLPRRLMTDAEYMHRFRFLFARTFALYTHTVCAQWWLYREDQGAVLHR